MALTLDFILALGIGVDTLLASPPGRSDADQRDASVPSAGWGGRSNR